MNPKQLAALVLLAAVWGASFLFIRVAAPALGPLPLMAARVVIAAGALAAIALVRRTPIAVRPYWRRLLVLALLNAAAPFTLIATAELRLSASMAAVLIAGVPLVAALIDGRGTDGGMSARRMVGLLAGVMGVGVLMGWSPVRLDGPTVLSIGLTLLATASYGAGSVYARRTLAGVPVLTLALGQQIAAATWLVVPALLTLPRTLPSVAAVGSLLGLALLSTALAYVVFFWLLAEVGSVKTSTVTYVIPVFGVAWGAMFLGERPTTGVIGGLACILASLLLVNGARRSSSSAGSASTGRNNAPARSALDATERRISSSMRRRRPSPGSASRAPPSA